MPRVPGILFLGSCFRIALRHPAAHRGSRMFSSQPAPTRGTTSQFASALGSRPPSKRLFFPRKELRATVNQRRWARGSHGAGLRAALLKVFLGPRSRGESPISDLWLTGLTYDHSFQVASHASPASPSKGMQCTWPSLPKPVLPAVQRKRRFSGRRPSVTKEQFRDYLHPSIPANCLIHYCHSFCTISSHIHIDVYHIHIDVHLI